MDPAAPADADDAPARVDVWSLSDVSFKVSEPAPVELPPPADRGGPAEPWCHALLNRMQDLLSVALSDVDGPQGLSRTLCIIALDLSRCVMEPLPAVHASSRGRPSLSRLTLAADPQALDLREGP